MRGKYILDITEALEEDETIVDYNLYEFNPVSGAQMNNPGNITINVNCSDDFYHPGYSWIEFEGQVRKQINGWDANFSEEIYQTKTKTAQ